MGYRACNLQGRVGEAPRSAIGGQDMSDQAPNIEPGKGKLVYNKERRIIVAVPQPLAEEIAGLIERLVSDKALPEERTTAAAMISAALRALAQENERLRQAATRNGELHLLSEQQEREEKHRERIRELEAEAQVHLNAYQQLFNKEGAALERIKGLEAACDGITELLEPTPDEMAIGDGYTFAKMKIEKLKSERDEWKQHAGPYWEDRAKKAEAERDKLAKQIGLANEAIESLKQESGNRCKEAVAARDALQRRVDLQADSYAYAPTPAKTTGHCSAIIPHLPHR